MSNLRQVFCGNQRNDFLPQTYFGTRDSGDPGLTGEGNRISSLTRVKGHKEDTILSWLREAARHAEELEEVLMKNYRIKRGQLDGLWAYVGNKGEKKLSRNA
jgi:hypothetical protein